MNISIYLINILFTYVNKYGYNKCKYYYKAKLTADDERNVMNVEQLSCFVRTCCHLFL